MQMAKWRKVHLLLPPVRLLDITVKSGMKIFAPTWDFLMEYKNSNKDAEAEAVYTRKFRAKIRQLYRDNPDALLELLYSERLALMCYCPAGKFCHRHLLVRTLRALGRLHGVDVVLMGEIT
ncbi:hypothetical protein BIZ78_gp148 [Erwinia phage vB_EamM_Caitlin]|uniref:hypothetical protein n=1 Tax=Erwinia phage vB_EamM_Caitlin TaxID=1883379 RepID=UPI00081CAFE4|nr:hypothetical protein BIZ78_gp148 [Erwinia phage vB_EamM_Caitlin]ANZ48427.1 hypothetical protein CAITLIN_132 [Erwinia phage vB_EamM_Caitlin]